jgi:single-stranded-DNA-specific exonuclease
MDLDSMPVIVMGNPEWRPGILGLVANKLMEMYQKPVFLWGREGGEIIRGSCRSDGSVNIVDLMAAARDIFTHFGGHAASGGFSVLEEDIHVLPGRLHEAYRSLNAGMAEAIETLLDRELDLSEISYAHKDLQKLAPFGVGNTKPLFLFPNLSVASARMFGKTQNHLELTLMRGNARVSGISFFFTPESFTKKTLEGEKVDIVGHVEADWRGGPRIRVVDVL